MQTIIVAFKNQAGEKFQGKHLAVVGMSGKLQGDPGLSGRFNLRGGMDQEDVRFGKVKVPEQGAKIFFLPSFRKGDCR